MAERENQMSYYIVETHDHALHAIPGEDTIKNHNGMLWFEDADGGIDAIFPLGSFIRVTYTEGTHGGS